MGEAFDGTTTIVLLHVHVRLPVWVSMWCMHVSGEVKQYAFVTASHVCTCNSTCGSLIECENASSSCPFVCCNYHHRYFCRKLKIEFQLTSCYR